MKLKELMTNHTPAPDFEGFVTNDDFALAVDISGVEDTKPDDYEIAQLGVAGLDAQLNPTSSDMHYMRGGKTTLKTGDQRTFKVTGDRYIGDAFQDYAFSSKIKYGTGEGVIVPYVYFCILNGKGEKGEVSIIVNSDGGGNAGESSGIDIDLKKAGEGTSDFTYTPSVT